MRALILAVLLFLLSASGAYAWTWPVQGPVLVGFVFDASHPYAGGQHRGIDIGAATGTDVLAPASGRVSYAGTVPSSGKSVTIATPDGYSVTLTHLGSIAVSAGASIGEGDGVGTVGPSGTPELDVPYVYMGVRVTSEAQGYVDPLSFLPPLPPPVVPSPPPPPPSPVSVPVPPATMTTAPASDTTTGVPDTDAVSGTAAAPSGTATVSDSDTVSDTAAGSPDSATVSGTATAPADAASPPAPDTAGSPHGSGADASAPPSDSAPEPATPESASPPDEAAPEPAPAPAVPVSAPAPPTPAPVRPHATVVNPDPGIDPTVPDTAAASPAASGQVASVEPAPVQAAPVQPAASVGLSPDGDAPAIAVLPSPLPVLAAVDHALRAHSLVPALAAIVAPAPRDVSRPAPLPAVLPTTAPSTTAAPAAREPRPRAVTHGPGARRGNGVHATASPARQPAATRRHHRWPIFVVAALALGLGCAAVLKAVRMIRRTPEHVEGAQPDAVAEDPGRGRLAVRERPAAPGPCRRPGRAVRHLRALSPAQRQRRPHGERDGRAWDAGDGFGRSRRRVAS